MRQAGVVAAAGIVAVQKQRDRLIEDHEDARLLAERIDSNGKIKINMENIETNMVRIDVSPSGRDAKSFQHDLEKRGLKAKAISEKFIRMVTYQEIQREDIIKAFDIINADCESL
jgi:threonine aldolase